MHKREIECHIYFTVSASDYLDVRVELYRESALREARASSCRKVARFLRGDRRFFFFCLAVFGSQVWGFTGCVWGFLGACVV